MISSSRPTLIQWSFLLTALAGILLAGCSPRPDDTTQAPATPAAEATPQTVSQSDSGIIARTAHGDITLDDLRYQHLVRPFQSLMNLDPRQLPASTPIEVQRAANLFFSRPELATPEQLDKAARELAARLAAATAFENEADTTTTLQAQQFIDSQQQDLYGRFLSVSKVDMNLDHIDDATVAAYYDQHKMEFRQPFGFRMRHLILTTYETYEVLEGDTLESIAERISGDESKAEQIRADLAGRPLRRESSKLFKPLVPGERLLVPVDEERADEIRRRLETILAELEQGRSFEELVREHSDNEGGDEPTDWMPTGTLDPPMLAEILDAARATEIGAVSQPFRTRHGWQVIQIVDKREEGYLPLEEATPIIIATLQGAQREKLEGEMLEGLLDQEGVTVHAELIAEQGTQLDSQTVIVDMGDTNFVWGQFRHEWDRRGQPSEINQIRRLLRETIALRQLLTRHWAKTQLADPDSELSRLLNYYTSGVKGLFWLNRQLQQRSQQEFDQARVEAFYKANPEMYEAPRSVTVTIMERRLSPAEQELTGIAHEDALKRQLSSMASDLERAKSPKDFRTQASAMRVLIEGEQVLSGQTVELPIEALAFHLREQVEGVEVGQWTEPFIYDDRSVLSFLVESRHEGGVRPLEAVADQIRQQLMNETREEVYQTLIDEYAERAQYQYVGSAAR